MRSPFKFLDAFKLEDKAAFFGREQETEALYEMIFRTPLLLVYGASGAGKTSLIQCGLAARFDGPEWYPFFIRRQDNINESLRTSLLAALEQAPADDSVTGLVSEIFEEYLSPVYLIFDQFEELFVLGSPEEQKRFATDIKALLAAELSCKIIFIVREEYLGRLNPLEKTIPKLFDFRLRVEPMTDLRIEEVLKSSFAAFNISLESPEKDRLEEMINNLNSGKSGIQLPYLQVYLDMLWREDYQRTYGSQETRPSSGPKTLTYPPLEFTKDEIAKFGKIEDVLKKFLQQQRLDLQRQLQQEYPELPKETVRQVFDAFVTVEGTKRPIGFTREKEHKYIVLEENAQKLVLGISAAPLTHCLETLEESRLLRFSQDTIELAHDSLAALIDEQRTDEQRQLNEVKMRIEASYREWERTKEFLSRKQLTSLEDYLPKVQLEEHLTQFVTDSSDEANRKEEEAQEKRQAELDKERKLRRMERERELREEAQAARAAAEQSQYLAEENAKIATANAKRAKQWTRLAVVISFLALVLACLAGWSYWRANKNAELAAESAEDAKEALTGLQKSNTTVVQLILDNARKEVMNLDYENALLNIREVDRIGALKDSVVLAYLEIAFWHNEAGRRDRAVDILGSAATVANKERIRSALQNIPKNATAARDSLRETIKAFDPLAFETYWERYYPVMVEVDGGTFTMGCNPKIDSNCIFDNNFSETLHEATVSKFVIAKYETTWWQYHLFCVATGYEYVDPSWGRDGNNPAVNITWEAAVKYANWVSDQQNFEKAIQIDTNPTKYVLDLSAPGYRLPTEAEWEYAARGGPVQESFIYSGSNTPDSVGWYEQNANSRTQGVGRLKPNALGLYDMSGNVREWCWDWRDKYPKNALTDYVGPGRGKGRILRGGSWRGKAASVRVSKRNYGGDLDGRGVTYGFRLSRSRGR